MCILFIAVKQHPDYPLIIAANRDEFHNRPTHSSHWWQNSPSILAGKDLQAGGTWMGVTKTGNIAALTNIRDPKRIINTAKSRGELVTDALTIDATELSTKLTRHRHDYNGYNLLFGSMDSLQVYNNFNNSFESLHQGVHGLSNDSLNSPWPKTTKGMSALSEYCQHPGDMNDEDLFAILRDDVKAPDDQLPQTGVPYEWEKQLSSAFIMTPEYGTRSSTLLLISNQGKVQWHERTFNAKGTMLETNHYTFTIETTG